MKRLLVCGSNGLVGQRLALLFGHTTDYEVLHTSHHRNFNLDRGFFDYTQLDITVRSDVKSLVTSYRPDIIINTAAISSVDECERQRENAWRVNVNGVENLTDAARLIGAKMIHLSTDYVFDGKYGPYTEIDRVNPINYYGKTKLAGENVILSGGVPFAILRVILVYGGGVALKKNFATWVIEALRRGESINCAVDQVANPTYVGSVGSAVLSVIERDGRGVFHICDSERLSRYDFAMRIAEAFGLDRELIHKIQSSGLNQAAPRPLSTGFLVDKARNEVGFEPGNVRNGLEALRRDLHIETMNE
ncbi:MAG TPA: dTDP-4-dehydrorhamnose reductase [Bacteroidota bacterium]|nr:dTDP-4-dehydrorhamnose reductase [Bacteroidota bacterium]